MLLSNVSDEQLLTSQIVTILFLCLITLGIVYNLYKVVRSKETVRRVISAGIVVVLGITAYFTNREYRIQASLLSDAHYVPGRTVEYCSVTGLGKGVRFEYTIHGKVYRVCNTVHPVPIDSVVVPDGQYMVRYSEHDPGNGRIDFRHPVQPKDHHTIKNNN